ncbi:MAG: phosphotransferase family protein [Candidatus Dormibacteria bacterium]
MIDRMGSDQLGPLSLNDPQGDRSPPPGAGLRRMAESIGGGEVEHVRPLDAGIGAITHELSIGSQRLVLKRFTEQPSGASEEFHNLTLALRARVPTPAPVALDEDGRWFGSPALVMSLLPGAHNVFPVDADCWMRELARALAAIHDVSAVEDGIHRRPRWARWTPWPDDPSPRLRRVTETIAELRTMAPLEPPVFSHDDFHPGNVLFEGDVLTGVVDWGEITFEPRQAGVAYCRHCLAIFPGDDAPDRFLAAYEAEARVRLADLSWWDVLCGTRGLQPVDHWLPAMAALGLNVAADDVRHASEEWVDRALARASRASGPRP